MIKTEILKIERPVQDELAELIISKRNVREKSKRLLIIQKTISRRIYQCRQILRKRAEQRRKDISEDIKNNIGTLAQIGKKYGISRQRVLQIKQEDSFND